ncbi:MAG: hypothetical protein K6B64_02625 [Acholeplasmatales bacterium]|nr:hypothetical protein [Acholeplasmatales bacterium]
MKKILLVPFIASTFFLFSCNNKDVNTSESNMNFTKEDVKEIRLESGFFGVEPGVLIKTLYSTDDNDISNFYNAFDTNLKKADHYEPVAGGGYRRITFYTNDNQSYNFYVNNGYYYKDDTYYKASIPTLNNPYLQAYMFTTYFKEDVVYNIKGDSIKDTIDYLGNIEFKKLEDTTLNTEASYYIDLSDRILIYDSVKFEYEGNLYQIISDINFSSLFI